MSEYRVIKISDTGSKMGVSRGGSEQGAIRDAQTYARQDPKHRYQVLDPQGRVVFQA